MLDIYRHLLIPHRVTEDNNDKCHGINKFLNRCLTQRRFVNFYRHFTVCLRTSTRCAIKRTMSLLCSDTYIKLHVKSTTCFKRSCTVNNHSLFNEAKLRYKEIAISQRTNYTKITSSWWHLNNVSKQYSKLHFKKLIHVSTSTEVLRLYRVRIKITNMDCIKFNRINIWLFIKSFKQTTDWANTHFQ